MNFFAASSVVAKLYSFAAFAVNFIELSWTTKDFIGMKTISETTASVAESTVTCFLSCCEALVDLSEELSTEPVDALN